MGGVDFVLSTTQAPNEPPKTLASIMVEEITNLPAWEKAQ